jgi:RecA/RadA recombinase
MNKHSKQRYWRRRQWLDKPHIPCGAITALVGPPGSGKTTIAFDIARRTASGHCDACGCPRLGGAVLSITRDTEEVKRMHGRTQFGGSTRPSLDFVAMQFPVGRQSVEILQRVIVDSGAKLVVVDEFDDLPRGEHGLSESHSERDALGVLAEAARSTNAAVVVLARTTKAQDQHGLGAVATGQALLGISRSVLQVTLHPVGGHWRRVRHIKSSLGVAGRGWEIDLANIG